jgi:hypothetical protein
LIPATRSSPLSISSITLGRIVCCVCVVWATAFAFLYGRITHYRPGMVAIWIAVMSHWVLDWLTHGPDMPLYPGRPRFGLELWNSIAGTMVVEIAMFGAGVWLYAHATRARDRIGQYALFGYVVLLLLTYVGDRFSGHRLRPARSHGRA